MERIIVKNMVCDRCIRVVRQEFTRLGLPPQDVRLGEVDLEKAPGEAQMGALRETLASWGFEVLDDRNARLVTRVKAEIQSLLSAKGLPRTRLSVHLARALGKDYSAISSLFSSTEGITIEQYFILRRIEKVKEFLAYGELSVKEIAFNLGFSSTAHLSNQFKRVTGLTPRHFQLIGEARRKAE